MRKPALELIQATLEIDATFVPTSPISPISSPPIFSPPISSPPISSPPISSPPIHIIENSETDEESPSALNTPISSPLPTSTSRPRSLSFNRRTNQSITHLSRRNSSPPPIQQESIEERTFLIN